MKTVNPASARNRGHTVHQCVVIQGHSVRLGVVIFRLYAPLRCCLCRHARPMLVPSVYALPGQPSSPALSFLLLVPKSPSAGLMLRAVPGRLPHCRDDLRQPIMRRLILVPVQTARQPLASTCSPRPTPSEDPADSPRNERKSLIQVGRLEDDYLTNFKLVQETLMFRQHSARESSIPGSMAGAHPRMDVIASCGKFANSLAYSNAALYTLHDQTSSEAIFAAICGPGNALVIWGRRYTGC